MWLECPFCSQIFNDDHAMVGIEIECPHCHELFIISCDYIWDLGI